MDIVRRDKDVIVEDAQKLTYTLIQAPTPDLISVYANARILLNGLILYVLAGDKKEKILGEVVRILMDDFAKTLPSILKSIENKIHPSGLRFLQHFLTKTDKIQSKNMSVLMSCLEPWTNPLIDYATSKSDFDIRDFRKNKSTLYINVLPSDMQRLEPLMRFFYQHLLDNLMTAEQCVPHFQKEQTGITFILDEFPTIGKMDTISAYVSYCRGHRIRLALIAQNIQQIESVYGESNTNAVLSNTTFKIVFAANDEKTARIISELCIDKSTNKSLLSWQKIITLPRNEEIILIEGEESIQAKKFVYYEDEEMKRKVIKSIKIK